MTLKSSSVRFPIPFLSSSYPSSMSTISSIMIESDLRVEAVGFSLQRSAWMWAAYAELQHTWTVSSGVCNDRVTHGHDNTVRWWPIFHCTASSSNLFLYINYLSSHPILLLFQCNPWATPEITGTTLTKSRITEVCGRNESGLRFGEEQDAGEFGHGCSWIQDRCCMSSHPRVSGWIELESQRVWNGEIPHHFLLF